MAVVYMMFFFFKQKTAYEMLRSLVGSEMCIRDSPYAVVVLDELNRILFLNRAGENLSGYKSGDLAGLSLIHI